MAEVWNAAFPYVAALLPTIGVAFLFYHIMKYILEGDRRERLAQARWEREQGASAAADTHGASAISGPAADAPEPEADHGPRSTAP